jgi:hypothetical protein
VQDCAEKRGRAVFAHRIEVGAGGGEHLDRAHIPPVHGVVQRRVARRVPGVYGDRRQVLEPHRVGDVPQQQSDVAGCGAPQLGHDIRYFMLLRCSGAIHEAEHRTRAGGFK